MNKQLADALNIKFINKKGYKHGARLEDIDVCVNSDKGKYTLTFNNATSKKLGEYVAVAVVSSRIYIVPNKDSKIAYKLSKNGSRKRVQIGKSIIGNIDRFIGDHELRYWDDLDAYYIVDNNYEGREV